MKKLVVQVGIEPLAEIKGEFYWMLIYFARSQFVLLVRFCFDYLRLSCSKNLNFFSYMTKSLVYDREQYSFWMLYFSNPYH